MTEIKDYFAAAVKLSAAVRSVVRSVVSSWGGAHDGARSAVKTLGYQARARLRQAAVT
jgi:hypothetical protein